MRLWNLCCSETPCFGIAKPRSGFAARRRRGPTRRKVQTSDCFVRSTTGWNDVANICFVIGTTLPRQDDIVLQSGTQFDQMAGVPFSKPISFDGPDQPIFLEWKVVVFWQLQKVDIMWMMYRGVVICTCFGFTRVRHRLATRTAF